MPEKPSAELPAELSDKKGETFRAANLERSAGRERPFGPPRATPDPPKRARPDPVVGSYPKGDPYVLRAIDRPTSRSPAW